MKDYNPRGETAALLQQALETIKSVPYDVSTRWTFYQLTQIHGFPKSDYKRFLGILSKARHAFWEGWRPDTLTDDTREIIELESGFDNVEDWLSVMGDEKPMYPAVADQEYILQVWFEAAAMRAQFEYYLSKYRIDLVPFGGDPSIRHKWNVARRLASLHKKYEDKPIVVLYFGDLDPKGLQIPVSALKHIHNWMDSLSEFDNPLEQVSDTEWADCTEEFKYIRVGLNRNQIGPLDIPDNPEKPGTYQWEALNDEQAGEMILKAIKPYWSKSGIEDTEKKENAVGEKWNTYIKKNAKNIARKLK